MMNMERREIRAAMGYTVRGGTSPHPAPLGNRKGGRVVKREREREKGERISAGGEREERRNSTPPLPPTHHHHHQNTRVFVDDFS